MKITLAPIQRTGINCYLCTMPNLTEIDSEGLGLKKIKLFIDEDKESSEKTLIIRFNGNILGNFIQIGKDEIDAVSIREKFDRQRDLKLELQLVKELLKDLEDEEGQFPEFKGITDLILDLSEIKEISPKGLAILLECKDTLGLDINCSSPLLPERLHGPLKLYNLAPIVTRTVSSLEHPLSRSFAIIANAA